MGKIILVFLITVLQIVISADDKQADQVTCRENRTTSQVSPYQESGSTTSSLQNDKVTDDLVAQYQAAKAQQPSHIQVVWTPQFVTILVFTILGFGLMILVMVTILLHKTDRNGRHTLRVFGILSIIIFSVVVVVIGYSETQLTPIIGLFGAIAGYLLGKDSSHSSSGPSST